LNTNHEPTRIHFTVLGRAKTAGSKRAFVNPKTGKAIVTDDSGKAGKEWRADVKSCAREAWDGPLLEGPLTVVLTVFRARPKSHFRANGDLKDSAPATPTTRPDLTKYARAAEDALTGILWRDDSQITDQVHAKRYGEPERLDVTVVER
jgi:Holliday junction resolvase RusA-like endonuclease